MKYLLVLVLMLAMVSCETTTGYRKSAGGQTSNKVVKVDFKNVSVTGNVILDLDDGLSSVGDADQGGTAQGSLNPEVKDNQVEANQ